MTSESRAVAHGGRTTIPPFQLAFKAAVLHLARDGLEVFAGRLSLARCDPTS